MIDDADSDNNALHALIQKKRFSFWDLFFAEDARDNLDHEVVDLDSTEKPVRSPMVGDQNLIDGNSINIYLFLFFTLPYSSLRQYTSNGDYKE